MPYITDGSRIFYYAIREKTTRYRQNGDPYIFIGMTTNKRIQNGTYLDYFLNRVTVDDSLNHQEVHNYLNTIDQRNIYVQSLRRGYYNSNTSKFISEQLQQQHDVIFPYP